MHPGMTSLVVFAGGAVLWAWQWNAGWAAAVALFGCYAVLDCVAINKLRCGAKAGWTPHLQSALLALTASWLLTSSGPTEPALFAWPAVAFGSAAWEALTGRVERLL